MEVPSDGINIYVPDPSNDGYGSLLHWGQTPQNASWWSLSLFLWLCEGTPGVISPVLGAFPRAAPHGSAGELLLGILDLKAASHLEGPPQLRKAWARDPR